MFNIFELRLCMFLCMVKFLPSIVVSLIFATETNMFSLVMRHDTRSHSDSNTMTLLYEYPSCVYNHCGSHNSNHRTHALSTFNDAFVNIHCSLRIAIFIYWFTTNIYIQRSLYSFSCCVCLILAVQTQHCTSWHHKQATCSVNQHRNVSGEFPVTLDTLCIFICPIYFSNPIYTIPSSYHCMVLVLNTHATERIISKPFLYTLIPYFRNTS